jgi:hypothetical protein
VESIAPLAVAISQRSACSQRAFAYLYCNFRRQHEQKLEDLITALLKQLVQRQSSVSDSVKNLYQQHNRPSLDEFLRDLHSVIANFSTVYIIIDTLDECQIVDGCRATFLSTLFNLQSKTRARLVAISRAILDIEKEFKGCLSREILASDKDIQRYLDSHIAQLPRCVLTKPKLQEEIKFKDYFC